MTIILQEPYEQRPIHFMELWHESEWRLKVYGIAYHKPFPRSELIQSAKAVARLHLLKQEHGRQHYHVGFLGIHDGRGSNFVFLSYWSNENELNHHVYISPAEKPTALEYATPTGVIACVWDLRVMCFERQAWLDAVLTNPLGPDIEKYLATRLNENI